MSAYSPATLTALVAARSSLSTARNALAVGPKGSAAYAAWWALEAASLALRLAESEIANDIEARRYIAETQA